MASPAWWIVAVAVVAGCGDDTGTPSPDAATPVEITELRVYDPTALPGDQVTVSASLRGVAMANLTYSFSAPSGRFEPTDGALSLDEAGEAELFAIYYPDAPGTMTLSLRASASTRTVDLEVLELLVHGLETGSASVTAAVNQYLGAKITVPVSSNLRRVGIHARGDATAQVGLYMDNAGVPSTRLNWIQGALLTNGPNSLPMDQLLAAGDYWLIATFGTSVDIAAGPGMGPRTGTAPSSGSALPLNMTNVTFSISSANQLAYSLVVVPE